MVDVMMKIVCSQSYARILNVIATHPNCRCKIIITYETGGEIVPNCHYHLFTLMLEFNPFVNI